MNLRERGCGDMDRIYLDQDRGQWRALVNTAMNIRFHKMLGNPRLAERLAASQEGLRVS
jgi:hypothetical protein